ALTAERPFGEVRTVTRADGAQRRADALLGAGVIVTATNSTTPVFAAADVEAGAHVICVGSGNAGAAEVEPELLARAAAIRPDHHVKLYRDLLEDAELAESLGFDSIWLSEHHFWFDGYCPSDLAAAGAILGRTSKLGVGTAVMLLPMHPAARVGADAATLSRLGEGRLSLGVALGYREPEFDGFGLRRKDRGKLMDALLPELAALCAVARPAVPIYVGVATAVAAQRAGRLGLPLFADSTMNPDELREMLAAYDAARE